MRNTRLKRGYSIADIAAKLNISPFVFYKWEDGTRTPLIKNAHQVATLLDSSIEELFFDYKLDSMSNKNDENAKEV